MQHKVISTSSCRVIPALTATLLVLCLPPVWPCGSIWTQVTIEFVDFRIIMLYFINFTLATLRFKFAASVNSNCGFIFLSLSHEVLFVS